MLTAYTNFRCVASCMCDVRMGALLSLKLNPSYFQKKNQAK